MKSRRCGRVAQVDLPFIVTSAAARGETRLMKASLTMKDAAMDMRETLSETLSAGVDEQRSALVPSHEGSRRCPMKVRVLAERVRTTGAALLVELQAEPASAVCHVEVAGFSFSDTIKRIIRVLVAASLARQPSSSVVANLDKMALAPHTASTVSVLLVDDDYFMQVAAQTVLAQSGVTNVALADNGAEALELLTTGGPTFTVALIDLQMPVMDGLQCVRELRAWEAKQPGSHRRLFTIAVSSDVHDEHARAVCLKAGFDDVHPTPLTVPWVQDTLLELA
jgi:CheY-like chemotaxis protein